MFSALAALQAYVTAPTVQIFTTLQNYYLFFGGLASVIVISYMMYCIVKNRQRPGREVPAYHHEDGDWGNWKSVVMLLCVTGTVLAFVEYETFASAGIMTLPNDPDMTVNVVGIQYNWLFTYPNGYLSAGNLTVPENSIIVLNITSHDVTHGFFIPSLDVGKDAQPGIFNQLWFNATQPGSFLIECRQLCGPGHALMHATLTVVSEAAYTTWYNSLPVTTTTTSSTSSGGV